MLIRLILLLTIVPIVELTIILKAHDVFVTAFGSTDAILFTVGVIVITGILGAKLAKHQGLQAISQIRESLRTGKMPTSALIDGVMILLGGFLLLTPGYLTDILGISLLLPPCRIILRAKVKDWFQNALNKGIIQVQTAGSTHSSTKKRDDNVIDIIPEKDDD